MNPELTVHGARARHGGAHAITRTTWREALAFGLRGASMSHRRVSTCCRPVLLVTFVTGKDQLNPGLFGISSD